VPPRPPNPSEHPLSRSSSACYTAEMALAPALLLSMPQLLDPNFVRTVVLLCEHAPEGAFGLVVNRPSDVRAADAVSLEPAIDAPNELPLFIGGPVEPQRGWILTAEPPKNIEHRELGSGLFLSASPVLLRRALMTQPKPERTIVLAGYAGWGPGQLDQEIEMSSWLIMPVELDLIFDVAPGLSWDAAIRRLGADPNLLQMGQGVH
jgi:putative transcriptional regulator